MPWKWMAPMIINLEKCYHLIVNKALVMYVEVDQVQVNEHVHSQWK